MTADDGTAPQWMQILRTQDSWKLALSQLNTDSQNAFLLAVDECHLNLHYFVSDTHLFVGALRVSPKLKALVNTIVRDVDYFYEDLMWKTSGIIQNTPEHFAQVRTIRETTTLQEAEQRVTQYLQTTSELPALTPSMIQLSFQLRSKHHQAHLIEPFELAAAAYLSSPLPPQFAKDTWMAMLFERQGADTNAAFELFTRLSNPWAGLIHLIEESDDPDEPNT